MNLDMKKGLVHVCNKIIILIKTQGCHYNFKLLGVRKLDFRQRIKEQYVGTSFAFIFLLHCFLWSTAGLLIFRAVAEPRNSGKSAKSGEIHKNTQNTAKFGRNLIKYMSVQQFWNLSQLLGVFTCRKLANLCQNFVTETWKQCPETTRRRLCCEKLGTSHDVKVFAVGSFLEHIVVERANDVLC